MQCLILDNKEVKAAVDELTTVLGSKDAAYYVVSENNGYAIDQAPNGEPSKLFSDLLGYYNGNREQAIKAKVKVFTDEFKNWFGDWINNVEGSSKIVDENGEPLIVYHGTNEDNINIFDRSQQTGNTLKGTGTATLGNFFTDDKQKANGFANAVTFRRKNGTPTSYSVFLNIKNPIDFQTLHEFRQWSKEEGYYDEDGDFISTKIIPQENDGILIERTNQSDTSKEFVAINSNQIKSVDNQGTFFTQDNNIHRNETNASATFFSNIGDITGTWSDGSPHMSTTSGQVVERLKQYIPKDSIAYQILDLFSDTDIYIGITEEKDQLADGDYMWYSDGTHTIWINKELFEQTDMEYNAKSIVHEMVHAFTSRSFENVKNGVGTDLEIKVYNKVKDLLEFNRKLYQETHDEKGKWTGALYGLKDEHEFIAEFLTNEEFVNNIIDDARQKGLFEEVISKIREVWSAIIDLLTGKQHVKNTESTRDILMKLLSFNLEDNNESANVRFEKSLNNKVKQLETNIHEAEKYNFDTKEELDKRLSDIRQNLLSGLQSRLRSIDITDISKRTEVIENIKYQIANLQNAAISDFDVIASFITDLKLDVRDVGNRVVEAYKGQTDALTDEELVALNKNYFAFYCEQAKDIYNSLVNMNTYKQIVGEANYNKLMTELQLCKSILDQSYDAVKRMQVVNAQRIMLKEGIKVNSPTIYNYISENTRKTDFDISYITRVLGSGDRINDEAIKSLFNILQNTENSINEVVFQKANELNKLLKVAGNRNQKLLFEVDENGNTTGYIIRDLNYGRFYKDLKQFKEQLQKEFGVDHQTLQLPENIATRTEYNKRLNKWLSEHCERKYTNEFYDLMNSLSPEAASAREMIMSKIRTLSNKYRDNNGVIHYESMTDEEWNTLQQYELDKKELASIYDIYGNEKPEGSVERRIADELTELNNKLSKNLNKNYNQQKFQDLIEEKRNSLSKHEFKKWMDRNTRVVYTEEFYEQLANLDRADYGEAYAEYNRQKRAILNMFRDNRTGEVNPKLMPNSTKRLLDQLEIKMNNIRKSSKKKRSKTEFSKIARVVATEAYKRDEAAALAKDQEVPGSSEVFYLTNTYNTFTGTAPKSWYTKIAPKDSKYIQVIPSSNLSELSSESPFVNKNYKQDNDEYYQPKRSIYDNSKAYNKVMSNKALSELRKALIDTMEESNSKLNNLEYLNKYRLPQISGSLYKHLKASGFNPFAAVGNYLLDATTVKNDDVGINKKVLTSPDGTSLALIPQYFTKQLDDPATISADMVGSVIQYFKMAENFKQKNEVKGKVENIKSFLSQRKYTGTSTIGSIKRVFTGKQEPKLGTDTNIYKFAEKFINMNLYDVKTNALSISIKDREISITKLLKTITGYGTLRNLGLNFACAFTGFFTAAHAHLVNSLTGRYYTFGNAVSAFKDVVFDLFKHGLSVGSRTYKSEQMAYMDYFEVGSTMDSLFTNTNRPKFINVIQKQWAFGLYSVSDYFIKGQILNSVMYDYKYIDGQFMHHEMFYNKYGRTDETQQRWKKAKSFKALTKFSAGKIVAISPEYQQAVDKAKFTIGNAARQLAGSADGQLSPLQKAQMSANVFGAMCMMHRQYIPIILQQSFTMDRQWDYQTQREVEAILKTPLRVFAQTWKDKSGADLITTVLKQTFLNKGFSSELDRTNIKKLKIEAALCMCLYPLIRNILKEEADKDKRNILLNLFAYVMARTAFETTAPYNLVDIYSTIKTPTPLYSLLDNVGSVISYPYDLILSNIRGEKSKQGKMITRGAYRGKTQLERNIWKITPFKNLIELNDIPSKRRYYDTQITGD